MTRISPIAHTHKAYITSYLFVQREDVSNFLFSFDASSDTKFILSLSNAHLDS